ncbi:MAG: GrpB family protein [Trueperaceae bacterium]
MTIRRVGQESLKTLQRKLYFRKLAPRRIHCHVRVAGKANQRYALLSRDYLRAHPASAEAYAILKRLLATHLANLDTYADVKDPAVDLIALAAEAWAKQTNWEL